MRPVLHYLWRAWPSTLSSILLVASNKWLEKKLLRSLPCCVAYCEGCEPRCSRVVACLCAFVFTSRRVCLASFPLSEKVDVRHNHNTNSICQRYYREHYARLVLVLPCWRVLPLPFIEGKHEGSLAAPSSRLQFSAFTGLCLPLPHASHSQPRQRQQHRSRSQRMSLLVVRNRSISSQKHSPPTHHHGPVRLPPPSSKHRSQRSGEHTFGVVDGIPGVLRLGLHTSRARRPKADAWAQQ